MYVGNRYYTFRLGDAGFWSAYARYLAVGVLVAAGVVSLLSALVEMGGVDARLGQAIAAPARQSICIRPLQAVDLPDPGAPCGLRRPEAVEAKRGLTPLRYRLRWWKRSTTSSSSARAVPACAQPSRLTTPALT